MDERQTPGCEPEQTPEEIQDTDFDALKKTALRWLTPALALCIAALKARETDHGGPQS